MRILYVFPHPDDESFGPGPAMAKQARQNHDVFLLTLTKGGATKQRRKLGLSVEEMGEARAREMMDVAKVLSLKDLTILDFPDGGLKEMDPRTLEEAIARHVESVEPDVLVTYPVHGVSGFHDHLVAHAVVKRVFCARKGDRPGRLAFVALREAPQGGPFQLTVSAQDEIDCIVECAEEDVEAGRRALRCYKTYAETIARTGVLEHLSREVCFEIFQERHDPPLTDLFA